LPGADQPRSAAGVAIRRLSIPPAGPNGEPTAVSSGGSGELHRTGCLYVGTVVLGAAYLLLESEPVLLSEGDTFVLPDSLHSWHNPFDRAAIIVSAAFPLLADQR
jgi:quercetin dioxygenase-like cupin family protein